MKFSTLTIVSILTGKQLGRIDDIYKILDFMTADSVFTHQIPRAMRTCRPDLQRQFPDLAQITPEQITKETAAMISANLVEKFGPELEVAPLPPGVWQPKDPIEELLEMQINPEDAE